MPKIYCRMLKYSHKWSQALSHSGEPAPNWEESMMKTYRTLSVLAILLVYALTGLYAKQTTGTISGVVSDETGGVLRGVD